MAIQDDIKTLIGLQENFFAEHGQYFLGEITPAEIPTTRDVTTFTKIKAHPKRIPVDLEFEPTVKDWQFEVIGIMGNLIVKDKAPVSINKFAIRVRQYDENGRLVTIINGDLT